MSFSIDISSTSDNPEASLHLVIGKNVSNDKIIHYVIDNVQTKAAYGLISEKEAKELIVDATNKIGALSIPV